MPTEGLESIERSGPSTSEQDAKRSSRRNGARALRRGPRSRLPSPAETARTRESSCPNATVTTSCGPPPVLQTGAHLANRFLRGAQGALPVGFDLKKPFRPPAALGGGFAGERADVAFRL